MEQQIGKLEKVALRDLWKHEAKDFSAWLAEEENLTMLGDTIGIDICKIETESHVGGFFVDILAEEQGTGNKIIIENQLEETNHDHLGKIITYASGKDAKYIIWIVKHARDEHRQAIEWLNNHTDENISFFLLEIEVWRIGNSLPAPKFNIVEKPNGWAKIEHSTTSEITARGNFCIDFWNEFKNYAANCTDFTKQFKLRNSHPNSWYDLSIGKKNRHLSLNVHTNKGTADIGIYIPDDKNFFEKLKKHSEEIAKKLAGEQLEWREATKACRIVITKSVDTSVKENWDSVFEWYIKMAPILKECAELEK